MIICMQHVAFECWIFRCGMQATIFPFTLWLYESYVVSSVCLSIIKILKDCCSVPKERYTQLRGSSRRYTRRSTQNKIMYANIKYAKFVRIIYFIYYYYYILILATQPSSKQPSSWQCDRRMCGGEEVDEKMCCHCKYDLFGIYIECPSVYVRFWEYLNGPKQEGEQARVLQIFTLMTDTKRNESKYIHTQNILFGKHKDWKRSGTELDCLANIEQPNNRHLRYYCSRQKHNCLLSMKLTKRVLFSLCHPVLVVTTRTLLTWIDLLL